MMTTNFVQERTMEKSLTTGEIARICQVSQATVLNWIRDRGLNAYTTAGGHYRVLPSELRAFAARYQMPIELPGTVGLLERPM
jgi:excisionase family DNA binding protein